MSLIQRLHKEGFKIYVLTPVDDYINFLVDNDYINFIPLKHLSRKKINVITEFKLYRELKAHYKNIEPDIVLQYTIKANIYGTMAAKRLGIESVVVIPGLGYTFTDSSKLKGIITRIYKRVLPYNKAVIFENHSDLAYFIDNKIISSDKGVVFKGCGVDVDHFAPQEQKVDDEVFRFLFMGRLIQEKGIEDYIKAAKILRQKYKNIEFFIIGHIDAENPTAIPNDVFLEWIRPSYIKYLGFKDDVREVIKEVDAVVLPSYYPEGIPRVLQEAMSMEKPIITANSDGCREAVDDGVNGYLCEPRSPQSLAQAMQKLIDLPLDDLKTMGKAGRKKAVNEFKEDITLDMYLNILNVQLKSVTVSQSHK